MNFTNQAFSTQLKCWFLATNYAFSPVIVDPFQNLTGAGIYIIYEWNPSQARCVLLDRQQNGRKKKAKLWPLRKGPFDQQLDYSNQLRKGKKKRRLKGGLEGQIILTATIEPAAYSGDCGAAMAAAPGYMAEQLAFPCSLSSEIVRREQCDKRSLSSHIFCTQKANDLRHLLFTPTRADTCSTASTGRADGQLGCWAAMLQLTHILPFSSINVQQPM